MYMRIMYPNTSYANSKNSKRQQNGHSNENYVPLRRQRNFKNWEQASPFIHKALRAKR